jgi:hypothetical protein
LLVAAAHKPAVVAQADYYKAQYLFHLVLH